MHKRIVILVSTFLFFVATVSAASVYTGFKEPKKGDWVVYNVNVKDGMQMEQKIVFVGEATMEGKKVHGIELVLNMTGEGPGVSQMWIEEKTEMPLKYVMQMGPQLMCMRMNFQQMMPADKMPSTQTPEEYSPDKPVVRYDTYTTPTGKRVRVAVFKNENGEVWVSSSVPFGVVKVIDNGKTVLTLKDFGSGAKPTLPVSKAIECQPVDMGEMMGGFGGS